MTKIKLPLWAVAWVLTLIVCGGVITYGYMTPSPAKITQNLKLPLEPKKEHAANAPTAAQLNPPSKKYASPAKGTTDDARISILLVNLGVDHATDTLAMQLPPEVSFAYRPTPTDLPQHIANHRKEGREVLLMIPMEPNGYPHNDPGPDALLTSLPVEENLKRLAHHLEKAEGVIGVGPFMGDAFTRNVESSEPVASWLSKHGYAVFDMTSAERRSNFINETMEYGGTYIDNPVLLDDFMADDRFREVKLDYLETVAKREGQSVGIVTATPKAVEQLQAWIKTFPDKQLVLTPVSTVYLYKSTRYESAEQKSDKKVEKILTDVQGRPVESTSGPDAKAPEQTESFQKVMTHEPTASTQNIKTTPLAPETDAKATTGDEKPSKDETATTGDAKTAAANETPAEDPKATTGNGKSTSNTKKEDAKAKANATAADAKPATADSKKTDAKISTADAKSAVDTKAKTGDVKSAKEKQTTTTETDPGKSDSKSTAADTKPTTDVKATTDVKTMTGDVKSASDAKKAEAKAAAADEKPAADAKATTAEAKSAEDMKATTEEVKPTAADTKPITDVKPTAEESPAATKSGKPGATPPSEANLDPAKPVTPQAPETPTKPVADTTKLKTETAPKPLSESPKS